jgi:hypothetical protein
MAPASSNTEIAQPCSVRIAGRRSFIISIEKPSCAKKDTASLASPIRNVEPRICTASSGYQNGVHLVPNALYRLDNTVEPTVRAEHCRQETQEEAARVVFTGYLTQEAVCVLQKPMSRAGQSGKDNTCKCLHTRSIVTCLLFPRGAAVGTRSGQGLGVEADDGAAQAICGTKAASQPRNTKCLKKQRRRLSCVANTPKPM